MTTYSPTYSPTSQPTTVPEIYEILEIIFIAGAGVSVVASAMVILTGLVFSEIMLAKYRPFTKMVFYISLADFFGSCGCLVGYDSYI